MFCDFNSHVFSSRALNIPTKASTFGAPSMYRVQTVSSKSNAIFWQMQPTRDRCLATKLLSSHVSLPLFFWFVLFSFRFGDIWMSEVRKEQ